jgi:hypothetical protein
MLGLGLGSFFLIFDICLGCLVFDLGERHLGGGMHYAYFLVCFILLGLDVLLVAWWLGGLLAPPLLALCFVLCLVVGLRSWFLVLVLSFLFLVFLVGSWFRSVFLSCSVVVIVCVSAFCLSSV